MIYLVVLGVIISTKLDAKMLPAAKTSRSRFFSMLHSIRAWYGRLALVLALADAQSNRCFALISSKASMNQDPCAFAGATLFEHSVLSIKRLTMNSKGIHVALHNLGILLALRALGFCVEVLGGSLGKTPGPT